MALSSRRGFFFALAVVSVAVVAIGTNALIGQVPSQKPGRQPGGAQSAPSEAVLPAQNQQPADVARTARLSQMNVAVTGQQVIITAKAEVYDTVPGHNYIWLLRIYESDKGKQLLKEHHYLQQPSALPQGELQMTPAFNDLIELPAGSYKAELSIYAVPPGFPVNAWKFGEDIKKKAVIKISGSQQFKIAN
jgi:hypothetical protein